MTTNAEGHFLLPKDPVHALVAYLIKKYKEVSNMTLGRIILQKLCYFAKASGVPLPFRFEIYHYGPFSQEVFEVTDSLMVDLVVIDRTQHEAQSDYSPGPNCESLLGAFKGPLSKYTSMLDNVAVTFSKLDPSQMELVSTIHYVHSSYQDWYRKAANKEDVVGLVSAIKQGKFDTDLVSRAYDILLDAGLLR